MKNEKLFEKRVNKLDQRHTFWVKLLFISKLICYLSMPFFLVGIFKIASGSWLWIALSVVSVLAFLLAFTFAKECVWEIRSIIEQLIIQINKKCSRPYKMEDFSWSEISGFLSFISLVRLAGFLIEDHTTPSLKVFSQEVIEAQKKWHQDTDKIFVEALPLISSTALSLKRRVKRAIGNYNMTQFDKRILLLSLLTYFDPSRGRKEEIKSFLGAWRYLIPQPNIEKNLNESMLRATKNSKLPYIPKKKPKPSNFKTAKPTSRTNQVIHDDVKIDLKVDKHIILDIELLSKFLPDGKNFKIVWAVLVDLLELGKTISMAGGYKRKEDLIIKGVNRIFVQEKWGQINRKDVVNEIDWLHKIGVLEKRTHGRDFGLNFKIQDKSDAGLEITKLCIEAKSQRTRD